LDHAQALLASPGMGADELAASVARVGTLLGVEPLSPR
jgi:hypothetical protein